MSLVLRLPGKGDHSLFPAIAKPMHTLIFVLYMQDFTIIIWVCGSLLLLAP